MIVSYLITSRTVSGCSYLVHFRDSFLELFVLAFLVAMSFLLHLVLERTLVWWFASSLPRTSMAGSIPCVDTGLVG